MRIRSSIFLSLAALMSVAAASIIPVDAAPKGKQRDFVIAGSDGYGTQDCLSTGGNCGRIVADSWCEAKGFKSALAYRKLDADEITGSTSTATAKPVDSFLISCKD